MTDTIVSIRNVTKSFPGGVKAVDNVSFDIAQNEFFALLGPSGVGKSVLLKTIIGLIRPDEGQVLVDGLEVPKLKRDALSELRTHIG